MSTRLRLATAADLDGMLALEAIFPSDRLSRPALRRFLRVQSAQVWVAAAPGQGIVGDLILLLHAGADHGRIYSVVVAPAARGQGLGNRLVTQAERVARAAGRSRLRLEVRADNAAARALYAKRGYVEIRRLEGYYEDGADGFRLEKTL